MRARISAGTGRVLLRPWGSKSSARALARTSVTCGTLFLAVLLYPATALANPRPMAPFLPLSFLAGLLLCGVVWLLVWLITRFGGGYVVMDRLSAMPDARPKSLLGLASFLGGLAGMYVVGLVIERLQHPMVRDLLVWPIILTCATGFFVTRGIQMGHWALTALRHKERPEFLAGVRPIRMLVSALLIGIAIPGGIAGGLASFAISFRHTQERHEAHKEAKELNMNLRMLAQYLGTKDLHDLFVDPESLKRPTLMETVEVQTRVIGELLKNGRDADIGLRPEVRAKLGPQVCELKPDPWGHDYLFFLGPWKLEPQWGFTAVPFRIHDSMGGMYASLADEYTIEIPGTHEQIGFPAPADNLVYVFSMGRNGRIDQLFAPGYAELPIEERGGGDDINNWDGKSGWGGLF